MKIKEGRRGRCWWWKGVLLKSKIQENSLQILPKRNCKNSEPTWMRFGCLLLWHLQTFVVTEGQTLASFLSLGKRDATTKASYVPASMLSRKFYVEEPDKGRIHRSLSWGMRFEPIWHTSRFSGVSAANHWWKWRNGVWHSLVSCWQALTSVNQNKKKQRSLVRDVTCISFPLSPQK